MYLTQAVHRSSQRNPNAPASIFDERVATFSEQADRVARLAVALRTLGVRDGERVGILALNSDRYAEPLLAVPWANAFTLSSCSGDHCKSLIGSYKAPRSCEFVDSLPVSPAGKLLKHELRKPYGKGAERQVA